MVLASIPTAGYRQVIAHGQPPITRVIPAYGQRTVTIRGREVQQLCIYYLGDMLWINVDDEDIRPVSEIGGYQQ
jgi:hypothetical protein